MNPPRTATPWARPGQPIAIGLLPFVLLSLGAKKPPVVILRFAPEVTVSPKSSEASPSRPLRIEPMTDARGREDAAVIGENLQNPGKPILVRAIGVFPPPPKPTGNLVTDYATEALQSCLTTWGVTQSDDAELVLRGQLTTLLVTEANKYKGEARITFQLESRNGELLWEGIAASEDSTWGRDLNPENYTLVLSNLLKKAYAELLNSPGFVAAWSGKGTAAAERVTPADLKATILRMLGEGLDAGVVADYVRGKRVVPALTPDDLVEWKRDGIPDVVMGAAIPQRAN